MDKKKYILLIAERLGHHQWQVENTVRLIDDGATIPFISRYRKEMTGSLDEVQINHIKDEYEKLIEIDKRREAIVRSIEEQDKMSPELLARINDAVTLTELEDIYLPYRPKRKTKASVAREKGLEPLADLVMKQDLSDPESEAASYLNDDVESVEDALHGARDIIAEWINEDEIARKRIRTLFSKEAMISSKMVKGKEEEAIKYRDYFEWSEVLSKCPSHRLLAMRRGEAEGMLRISIMPDEERALDLLDNIFVKADNASAEHILDAVKDSWKRLLGPAMETEFRNLAKEKADEEAIKVFTDNLRQLLLAPPLGGKRVLALDPGYRTGCKVVCLDEQGSLLHNETIFPHPPQN
ncbi:MAG TPA: Tex-like N-terminal domain-containing protein, partial [Bacteroidales bacterium]|nr:Tex-like N-terminal domain-containing protein [Bacteroidales bacterium]